MSRPRLFINTDSHWSFIAVGLLVLQMVLGVPGVNAGPAPEVLQIRHFSSPEKTRIVLDMSGPASYEIREIRDPGRLAVNIPRCSFRNTASVAVSDNLIQRIRCNPGQSRAQVVLDLNANIVFKTFSLPAGNGKPYRVVLDVFQVAEDSPEKSPVKKAENVEEPLVASTLPVVLDIQKTVKEAPDAVFTVIIDPGHGGLDPGAVRSGTLEKHIVLAVSRELARLLNGLPGYRAVLTRDGDYYPNLERRVDFATENNGDLFLSVHCNTHRKKKIKGMEVYFLSLQGATDREARELANKENAADLIGMDSHKTSDDMVMKILMDMRMTQVLHESSRLADTLLATTGSSSVVEKRKVKQAEFQVLRSLAMPSALVELAYLSNDSDLKILRSNQGREKLARVLAEGVLAWRRDLSGLAKLKMGVSESWGQKYAVRRGDNLFRLASKHGTTTEEIRSRNKLKSGALMVGQVLHLPKGVNQP